MHAAFWIPAVWVSYMADIEVFGLAPGALHATNVLLHVINTLLLFALLKRATGATGRSWVVAALFAVHPLHVESVAWITERKDVLSTLFWFAALHVYVNWVRRPTWTRYAAMAALFVGGLMAKPMVVTLPALLLVLDVWPLGRVARPGRQGIGALLADARRLVYEKIPLFAVSIGFSAIAYVAEGAGNSLTSGWVPLHLRIANAAISCVSYIARAFWPAGLVVLYPYPTPNPWLALGAGLGIAVATLGAIRLAKSDPSVLAGWLWYLVTLLPVVGLIQVGMQPTADRFTYVPLIGIFIAVAWGLPAVTPRWLRIRWAIPALSGVAIVLLMVAARRQVQVWENTLTLWQHAAEARPDNYVSQYHFARTLIGENRPAEAATRLTEVLRLFPEFSDAHFDLGLVWQELGQMPAAISEFREAIRIDPSQAERHMVLGGLLAQTGRNEEAENELREAIRLDPEHAAEAHQNLGLVLGLQKKSGEAIQHFQEAVRLNPQYVVARFNLAVALANEGRRDQAIEQLTEILRIDAGNQEAANLLAQLRKR
jgi:Flp pilus assembly protein TadD